MLEIKREIFNPLPNDPEVQIDLLPLSDLQRTDILCELNFSMKEKENESDLTDQEKRVLIKEQKDLEVAVIRECVVEVRGVIYDGNEIKTAEDLLKYAPQEIMPQIRAKAMSLFSLKASEAKK